MIDIRDLEAFLAILDSGSISKAAQDLGLTQPALSLKLKKIETQLGVSLFLRTPRNMIPQQAARSIESQVREIILKFDALPESLAQSLNELKGTVRVGSVMGWFQALLTPCAVSIAQQAPQLRTNLQVQDTIELIQAVLFGRLDFAIVAQPFESFDGLRLEHLFDEVLILFGRELPSAKKENERRLDLLSRPWVTMSVPDPLVEKYWSEQFAGKSFPWEKVSVPIVTDYISSMPKLVSQIPRAVAVAPKQIVTKAIDKGHLTISETMSHKNGVFLVYRENALSLKRLQLVRDILVQLAQEMISSENEQN